MRFGTLFAGRKANQKRKTMSEELKDKEEILKDTEDQETPENPETQENPNSSETPEPAAEPTPEELLALAKAEIEELKTQALYKQAEFENYRKRTIKEKADLILNGSKSAVTALLPIVDDLERALPSMKKAEDVAAVAEGVELIYQKFLKALEGLGVKQIDTEGKDFDVDLHEAVAQVPGVPDEQKGRVIDCVEKGYTLNDHVIRHAKVAVGM
jgi:molecular chaperone GrpE